MGTKRNQWIQGAVGVAALLSAIQLFSLADVSISRSVATVLMFATSYFGIQRLYSALLDVALIISSHPRRQLNDTTAPP
jgi:hypothetical protein